jgi:hypothetical protein
MSCYFHYIFQAPEVKQPGRGADHKPQQALKLKKEYS